ncbi:MAG: hypothetical protein JST63_13265 [Bacteroidetes bacterium]|nr:hypothetical protein [Bacteroidota bacterium]
MKSEIKFYACDIKPVDWENPASNNKWIDNSLQAMSSGLEYNNPSLNTRDTDSLYQTTAQYIFVIGGGDRWITADKCSGEVSGDTIIIKYAPQINHSTVGETAPSIICMELNKQKYPDYKKMKIVYKEI